MKKNTPVSLKQFGSAGFIVKSGEGMAVDLDKLESSAQFALFAERVFAANYYFSDLDYAAFEQLLCAYTPAMLQSRPSATAGKSGVLRFAAEVVAFPAERRPLYRMPFRTEDQEALYLFEPVMLEKTVQQPLYGQGADGSVQIVGHEEALFQERATLSFDEFVADMWQKGIRFGLDAVGVREILASGKTGKLAIARPKPPIDGIGASLQEQSDKLYRDDTPRRLSNGLFDLKQFKNRFPQIKAGERLLKKMPCIAGTPGMTIEGQVIDAAPPLDFDISTVAGPGTRIERGPDGIFIVADINGFLNINSASNSIAVTEKIISHGGVSMRTTGDLALDGEFFEEHGEVQESRVIKGRNITIHADVYGKIMSRGGEILLKQNLVGGSAHNQHGDVRVEGLSSNALIQAPEGCVCVGRAENAVICARQIQIESAVNCILVADQLQVQSASGCLIAGKDIRIETAGSRRHIQTMISVLLPDLSSFNQEISALRQQIDESEQKIEQLRQKALAFSQNEEVMNYLMVMDKLQRKEISLPAVQVESLKKTGVRIEPLLRATAKIKAAMHTLRTRQVALREQIASIKQEENAIASGVSCEIQLPEPDTQIRTLRRTLAELYEASPRELKTLLQIEAGDHHLPLSRSGGAFCWQPE